MLAAACSSDGGRGEQPAAPDTSIADNDTTTTTTQGVAEPATTTEAEPATTTTLVVEEPSTTAEAEPATTGDSDADITTTTTVDATTTTSDGDTHDGEVVVVPETDIGDPDEPTVVIPTTASTQPATTEPSTTAPSTTAPADTTTTTTTVSVELEVSQGVVCGDGLVKLDEFVTETDNGCRRAECRGGRDDQTGKCRRYGDWFDTLVRECPTVDTSDGLGAFGDIFVLGDRGTLSVRSTPPNPTFPQMVPGSSWVAEIQLADNANWDWWEGGVAPTGGSSYFIMSLGVGTYVPRVVGGSNGVLWKTNQEGGSQTVEFTVSANKPQEPAFGLGRSTKGAGCWAVRFTRTG